MAIPALPIYKSRVRLVAFFAVLTAAILCRPATSAAFVFSVQENVALYGNLNQHALGYSYPQYGVGSASMACAPTSALNSLVYLQNAFPAVYGTSLISLAGHDMDNNGSYTTKDDWIYTDGGILANSTHMNTTQASGTWHDNYIMGQYSYINSVAPGSSVFSAQNSWCPAYWGNVPTHWPPPTWVVGKMPTWDYIYAGLSDSAAVEIVFSYSDSSGHFVSATGMTWDNVLNSGTLYFMDPWYGTAGSTGIRLSNGKIYADYGGTNHAYISEVNVITPVPEPLSLAMLLASTVGLLVRRRDHGRRLA